MNTSKTNLRFKKHKPLKNNFASGTVYGNGKVDFSIDSSIADECGAELFVHEFNEVAILQTIKKVMNKSVEKTNKPFKLWNLSTFVISHNLNAESNGEYTEEHYLLHKYVESDTFSAIDHVWTIEETNFALMGAYPQMIFVRGAFPEKFI